MSGTAPTNLNPVSMSTEKPAEPEPIHGPMGESLAEPQPHDQPDPITQDIDQGADLLGQVREDIQSIFDFLHRLFPGHGAPGTPSTPPAPPAP